MKTAVISDLHSNLEALTAVLSDIDKQKVDRVMCLGDVVGYGANPIEVLTILRERNIPWLLGNHDEGVQLQINGDHEKLREYAGLSVHKSWEWTALQLLQHKDIACYFFEKRQPIKKENGITFAHGSPRGGMENTEYLHTFQVQEEHFFEPVFSAFDNICVVGHTHVPGSIFNEQGFVVAHPTYEPQPIRGKILLCAGSVGQPRDGNKDACYLLLNDNSYQFRRIPYDFKKTGEKIEKALGEDTDFSTRLEFGR